MERLDFSRYQSKYPLLAASDISFLNNFFNKEKILSFLWKQENIRRKINKISKFITFSILILIFIIFLISNEVTTFQLLTFPIFLIMFYFIIYFIIKFIVSLFFKFDKVVKDIILPSFVRAIDKDLSYSKTKKLFKESLSSIISSWLMKSYNRMDKHEDSILYNLLDESDKNWITIEWSEIKTSEKRTTRTKNGTSTYYVTNNHFYILKVKYYNAKYLFKNYIKLLEDINDNIKKKIVKVLWILFIWLMLIVNFFEKSLDSLFSIIESLANKAWLPVYIFIIVVLLFSFWVIFQIYSYFIWKKRIKLENIDFEKEFDVYSEDKIESRVLLTPSFMYRLVDYVNKISRKRIYELFFKDDYIYVKYDILKTGKSSKGYMEFSNSKSIYENLEDYIEFYLEIKNIISLVEDLKLFYYDKGKY